MDTARKIVSPFRPRLRLYRPEKPMQMTLKERFKYLQNPPRSTSGFVEGDLCEYQGQIVKVILAIGERIMIEQGASQFHVKKEELKWVRHSNV